MEENKEIVEVDVTGKFQMTTQEAKEKFKQLQEFIKKIMMPDVDYGKIAGRDVLFKSGAEKLENVHGFSHNFTELNRTEDFDKPFFFYRYKCEVYSRQGVKMGEAIGSANTLEKSRANQDPYSIANTIDKMAQKRAYVGAIINACRVSSNFTQDIDDEPEIVKRKDVTPPSPQKNTEYVCSKCGASISEGVHRFSVSKFNRSLCQGCQPK